MVLFKNDIARDGAYVDTMTTNVDFLKMAINLNKMGVKNNTFFLTLYDRELIGRDPHNLNDDSLELRQRIAYECKINFWYFIREVIRVVSSGTDGIPYKLNRANLAQAWIFFNSITGFLTMPRQIGKTIGMLCVCLWYLYISGRKLSWGMFCQGSMLQWDNVKRLKELRDALPKYLWFPSVSDSNNKEGISYAALDTHLQTFIAQMDKQAADRLGRGQTLAAESWDEIAYFVNNNLSWSSATAAMNNAAPAARAAGLPAAVMITTTAGDIDDKWGKFAYDMVVNAIRFTEKFYDVEDRDRLMNIIRTNSKNNIVYMEYSHTQLGKDDAWFEEVTRAKDPKVIEKDYLNHWLHGSDNSVFDKDLMDKILKSKRDPVDTTWIESVCIRWYQSTKDLMSKAELKNKPYVIGCDTSDNVCRDFTSLCMLDPYDLSTVATMRCNATNLMFVARCIVKLLVDFPRAIFIPERNKNGTMFLDYIFLEMKRLGLNPLKRIFNKYFQEYDPEVNLTNLNYDSGLIRKNFGFTTSASSLSRELLYSKVMTTALKLAAERIYDNDLISEYCGLIIKNNRVDHGDTGHDDLVISYLLACFFLLFGNNHKFYGLSMDEILCNVHTDGHQCTPDEKRIREAAKLQLVEYKAKLKRCGDNEILRNTYTREIQQLQSIIGDDMEGDPSESEFTPISQVAAHANEVKKRNIPISAENWIQMSMNSF